MSCDFTSILEMKFELILIIGALTLYIYGKAQRIDTKHQMGKTVLKPSMNTLIYLHIAWWVGTTIFILILMCKPSSWTFILAIILVMWIAGWIFWFRHRYLHKLGL